LTGNQLGSLLVDFLLARRKAAGTLGPQNYVVKTMVTTELIRHIAEHYGVQIAGDLYVGFKWIGAEMDVRGPDKFVFGAEESYGFLVGDHVRDKDAAVASLLTAELAAALKAEGAGKTLCQRLDKLYVQYGCYTEGQLSLQMPGEKGMDEMQALMARVRSTPPEKLGGLAVVRVRDYLAGTQKRRTRPGAVSAPELTCSPLAGPTGDLVILDLETEGNYVAVRPSGTEPKIKIYTFAHDRPAPAAEVESTKTAQADRLKSFALDFRRFAGA
jgi:phosphoglucomutase/phosphomannomutase